MKVNKLFFAVLFILVTFCDFSQTTQWLKSMGDSITEVNRMALDNSGNVHTIGSFYGTTVFGSFSLTAGGVSDAYITKTSPTGSIISVQQLGGPGIEDGERLRIDGSGNFYISGTFLGTSVFGTTTLTASSASYYVAKIDASGNVLWAKKFPKNNGINTVVYYDICINSLGDIYVGGSFTGSVVIGTTTLNASAGGYDDILIFKLDGSGNVVWVKKFGGINSERANSLATDGSGSLYIAGVFNGALSFGTFNLSSSGDYDGYVCKLTPLGNAVWAKKYGGTGPEYSSHLTVNSVSITAVGGYNAPATFGAFTFTSSAGYVMNLDTAGSITWVVPFSVPGIKSDWDASGNRYVTGNFIDSISFGALPSFTLDATGVGRNVFITKLDPGGNFIWAKRLGYRDHDIEMYDLVVSGTNIYATGLFKDTLEVDSYSLQPYDGIFHVKLYTDPIGIYEIQKELNVLVYPNPTKDKLSIELKEKGEELIYSLSDVTGEEVIRKKRITANETIDVSHFAKGIYFLQLETNSQRAIRKIVIE